MSDSSPLAKMGVDMTVSVGTVLFSTESLSGQKREGPGRDRVSDAI